jgi:NADPH:quinone reductase-like Zn-dependent oxidoreductase
MTAVAVATAFGGPEVLAVVDAPIGDPGPGEVRLRVRAAGTNAIDFKMYSGSFGRDETQLPMRLGLEAAGVVSEVGRDAVGPTGQVRVGDEVIAYRIAGGYAAEVVAPASSVVPKPSTLSFEQAGGLMLAGATAVHALKATAVGPGDTVVIHGGAGGVGLMAVQLAVHLGARVVATAAEASHPLLREYGAEPVAYGEGLADRLRALCPDGIQAALDLAGTDEAVDTSIALVADRDRIATIVAVPRGFELGIKVLGGAPGADPGTEIRAAARLELVELAEAGALEVRVDASYPLAEVAEAHRRLAEGHTHGKIVLTP